MWVTDAMGCKVKEPRSVALAALSPRLLRRLAFAKDVPATPDLPEQFSLALEEE